MRHYDKQPPSLLRMALVPLLCHIAHGLQCFADYYLYDAAKAGYESSGVLCAVGTFNPGCNYGCTTSYPGYYVSGTGWGSQLPCSAGYFSGAGSSSCTLIPSGYQATYTSSTPLLCPDGFYQSGSLCYPCPAGYVCSSANSPYSLSGSLWYSTGAVSYASAVPVGYSLANGNGMPPIPCGGQGYYWEPSTATCYQCPAGYACPISGTEISQVAIPCPAGTYSLAAQASCTGCPAGSYCSGSSVTACAAGYYSLGYASACTACPAGYYCPTSSKVPVLCEAGQFSTGSQTTCNIVLDAYHISPNLAAAATVACGVGTYWIYQGESAQPRCNACPVGFYCADPTQPPQPCPSGWYQNAQSQSSCIQCPAGSACPFPTEAPYTCPVNTGSTTLVQGYTSVAGMTSCYPNIAGLACTSGYYRYPNPSSDQIICPEGFACPNCYQAPQLCPTGYYSAAGAIVCTICEAGKMCASPYASRKIDCTNGYYSTAGSVNCYPVPSHMTSATVASRPLWILYGETSPLTSNVISPCAIGYQCLSDDYAQLKCPDSVDTTPVGTVYTPSESLTSSYTSLAYELSCYPNLATYGGTGRLFSASASQKFDYSVSPGYYTMAGGVHHFDCPKGRECLFPYENIFVQCPPGYYDPDGYFSCQPCPEGIVCPIMQHQYIANSGNGGIVQNGFFSPYGNHLELKIPAGWYTDSANSYIIRPCPAGYYSADGNVGSCIICPIGYNCPFAANEPIKCNEGSAAPSTGMRECTPCSDTQYYNTATGLCATKPTNYFAMHPIFAPQACPYNQQSDGTSSVNSEWVDCYTTEGQYYLKSSSSFLTCPLGYYCLTSGQSQTYTKYPCPPGTYATGTGQTSYNSCTYCPAGSYCVGGAAAPVTCPAGYICPSGTQFATQFPCPLASMRATTGGSAYTDCVACTSGMLCLEGTSDPFDCPPGENCATSPWTAGPCQSGTYSSGGVCVACPSGHYCITGTSFGLKCPSGTFTAGTGAKSPSDCQLTDVNHPQPKYGQSAYPSDYPVTLGFVYPLGTAFGQQLPCPAGQICDAGTLATAWTACPVNFACPQGSATTTAQNCQKGYRCPAGTLDIRQFPQASGYYSTTVGGTAVQCSAGYYCPKGTTVQRPCPLGYYCEIGTENFRLTPCPAGKYGKTILLAAESECTACPAGYYCQPGQILPIMCPAGTFSTGSADSAFATTGLGYSTPCTICTAGYQCPRAGTTQAVACGIGYFSPPGATQCFRCYAGHLCDTTTNTQAYMEANKCSGVQCLTFAIYETSSCPSGYYCDPSQFQPIACPVGTYQSASISQASSATCVNVDAGYYNDEIGQNLAQVQVKLCSPGYTCAAGSISRYATPCARGYYNALSGQTSCIDCPAGFFCLGATVYPIPCPAGYYCTVNSWSPVACPIGTFGANTMLTRLEDCTTCTKGSYCAEPGISAPTNLCNAGYYCVAGSIIPEPTVCEAGGFCEKGSFETRKCPAGYYNLNTNMKNFKDCALCTPGKFCDGSVTSDTTGDCQAGWYCESGSRVIDQYAAPPGTYTLAGAAAPTVCPATTYNPLYHQSVCPTCPAGFYCDKTGMTEPTICPIGKYCVTGSESPVQCPVGTYNPVLGGTSRDSHCLNCPPGRYCANKGLSTPSGDCAAGYFCLQSAETNKPSALDSVSSRWGKCPIGHYCPVGTSYPYPCPAGRYTNSEQMTAATDCTVCDAGYYCETTGLTAPTAQCDEGYYCPAGQLQPRKDAYKCTPGHYCPAGSENQIPCPAGSYQHQYYQASCIECPAGYYCPTGSATQTDPIICPAGAFCMKASTTFTLCPLGSFMPDTGATTSCISCPAGKYCGTMGLIAPTGDCSAGYYCQTQCFLPTPSTNGGQTQIGQYTPAGSGFPLQCPPGKGCPNAGMTDTDMAGTTYDCTAGYYCPLGSLSVAPADNICPTGNYCPTGTAAPIPCPPGTYRSITMGIAPEDCYPCPAGNYCPHYASTTYSLCDEGWYCETSATIGESSPTPYDTVNSVPKYCPVGYKCTSGIKTACSGNYQDQIGQNTCKTCPAGFQCTTTALIRCGNNNYCPSAQMEPTKCASGYYTVKFNAIANSECIICPAGYYCTCTNDPTDSYCDESIPVLPVVCPAGYYCAAGTELPTVECEEGYICPEGTYSQVPCPPGYTCDGTLNTASTMVACVAGNYCPGGSTTATAIACPEGYYCETQASFPVPCDLGTYNPTASSVDISACLACPSGATCSTRGQTVADAAAFTCESGFYCPTTTDKIECPKGYYCPQDSVNPTTCPAGYYTDNLAQAICAKCPAGFYCGDDILEAFTDTTIVMLADSAIACVAGQYCPSGSYLYDATQLPGKSCPIGTYNPYVGARNQGDCVSCPEGFSCTTVGIADDVAALTPCTEGYYCPAATISKASVKCPVGAYCPTGSPYFVNCPVGTYQDNKMMTVPDDCLACPVGYYCSDRGMTSSSKQNCGDGFTCLGGAKIGSPHSTQNGDFCPVGQFCSRVNVGPVDCAVGTYQPNTGQSSCVYCPTGKLCDTTALTAPNNCPVGNYCPAKTASITNEAINCPAGSYNEIENIGDVDLCVPCPPGKYCTAGQVALADSIDCDATFFCPLGSIAGSGYSNEYEFGVLESGLCPPGYTCPTGTIAPVPCPVGTFQAVAGSTTCDDCTGGYYCNQQGLSVLTSAQKCFAGYYCNTASDIPNPVGLAATKGDICQPGYYCPKGSAAPILCAAGTYEPREGSSACQICPAGFYCEIGSFKPTICQNGYCPEGSSEPTLCPDGTYGSETLKQLKASTDCPFCPNGKYCNSGFIQSDCDAGYYCDFGASQWQDESKICPTGQYCPSGTKLPIRCPSTLYYAGTGARDVSYCQPCAAGYYCLENDSVSRVCPVGYFCPEKSVDPIPCWAGTYNPYKRQSKSIHCMACPVGSNCNSTGIDDYTRHMCPAGYYCPTVGSTQQPTKCPPGTYRNQTGAAKIDDCWVCPAGYFCLEGSPYYSPCDAGYYCPEGSEEQIACPPGTYCPALSGNYTTCPQGYYCPTFRTDIYAKCGNGTYCGQGSYAQTNCPSGQFGTSATFNWNVTSSCIPCGPGQYSDSNSQSCQPCDAGYVCFAGATTARPTLPEQNGAICDPGFYCLKGSYSGIACPVGTYSNQKGNGQLNQCLPCPINTFGNAVGQTSCQKCQGSTVSEIGSTTCRCVGLNRKYLAAINSCVCLSGFEPVDGTSGQSDGLSDCQRLIYNKCTSSQERDSNGVCREKTDCSKECNNQTGTIQQNFGICQCNNIVTALQICNQECQSTLLQTSFTSSGQIRIYDPVTQNFTITAMPNTIGTAKCSKEDQTQCELVPVGMAANNSFSGAYELPNSIVQANETIATLQKQNLARRKTNNLKMHTGRQLQTAPTATYISNPVVCTTQGSAVLWDNLSNSTYPVYQKDSLLNTNQDFDFGTFSALPEKLKNVTSISFVYTFETAGTYVFADSRDPSKLMIVAVMNSENKCPPNSKFSPLTYASLLKVGAYQQPVLLPPDWSFFFITLICFIGLIVVAVLLVSWVARRDWKQKKIPSIIYQKSNYKAVEREDPSDVRAIVSINTDSSSFMFRAQGQQDGKDMGEQLVDRMKKQKTVKIKKGDKGRKDLSLNQVEKLKDSLHKHLKEIKKLRALRFGKDGLQVDDELGDDVSDYSSSSDDELNSAILNVKKMIQNARAVLKGEGDEDIQIFTEDTKLIEQINTQEDKRAERELAIKLRKEQLEESSKISDEKFKRKMGQQTDLNIKTLEDMKNKVLEMQVESAYDRGKGFQERMARAGAQQSELTDMMSQLETKMQRVEDLLLDDKDRQAEMLKRQLEQRRLRRHKLNEKLQQVDEHLHQNEYDQADRKQRIVKEIQEELKVELQAVDDEDQVLRQQLQHKFEIIKNDKLADYQDKLRNAGGSKDFQNILSSFQQAQLQVDKELQRQIDKENDKLDRDLKARRAKLKAQAEIRRNQRFKDDEIEQGLLVQQQVDTKAKIQEALTESDRKDGLVEDFASRLAEHANHDNMLVFDMENKRRDEEAFRQEHERKQRKLQAEAMKEQAVMDQDVNNEITRLLKQNTFEPFQQLVDERAKLQKQLELATETEKQLLIKQLREIDEEVKNQLGREAKDQDASLRRLLDQRKQKRQQAIEKERALKETHIQERIAFALQNSTQFAVYRNDLTQEAFQKIVQQMQLELTPEEIPAALEALIDDKHQKELSDWLLKLYEQKAIELKEVVLTLLEEKVAKQQVIKQTVDDRVRGIDAIISRGSDKQQNDLLAAKKAQLLKEAQLEINRLETEFAKTETFQTREIQSRSMDRETKALQQMSEMHFDEKKKIFEQYLPDSMMKDIIDELQKKEQEQMVLYQKELEFNKALKLKQMEDEERQIQVELAHQQSVISKLSENDQILARQEIDRQKRLKQFQREKAAVVSSQDVIHKIRMDMEKGLEGLSGAYEVEHQRQLQMMEARLATRGKAVQDALEQKKIQEMRKQEQAELERKKEQEIVRENRRRKQALLDTIQNNQQMAFKGCYSRPLYCFNKKLHDGQVANNDLAALLTNQQAELKEAVMGRLLTKVTELEDKVLADTKQPQKQNVQSIVGLLQRQQSRQVKDNESNGSSDKLSNARSIMGNLLKKKF